MVYLTLRFEKDSSLTFRGTSSVMKILQEEEKVKCAPSHETCIQWNLKIGLYKLLRAKQHTTKWCWIVDHVIGEGPLKCLVILGVPLNLINEREDLTLALSDVEPFGIVPMAHTTGKDVKNALMMVSESTGVIPCTILSDHGSDLWLGIKEFCKENGQRTVEFYDVCHKVAIELRKCFEKDPDWDDFRAKVTHTKKLLFSTNGVRYAPPNQRRKARYQNVDIIVGWANKILNLEDQIPLNIRDKLNWLFERQDKIKLWSQWIEIGKNVREEIRCRGFGEGAADRLATRLIPIDMTRSSENLACTLIDFVSVESEKLSCSKKVIGTTELIESLFGCFKRTKAGVWDRYGGIGRLILTMASRVGEMTLNVVKSALETVKTTDVNSWLYRSLCKIN